MDNLIKSRKNDLPTKNFQLINIETIRDYLRVREHGKELVYSKISINDDIRGKINKKGDTEVEPLSDGS